MKNSTEAPFELGCVSYLNSKPLIEPLVDNPRVRVRFAVPAALLGLIEKRQVQAALLPIVDYQKSHDPLLLVPAGAIGSDGPTYTVRIFSPVPPAEIHTLYADIESHTSVVLAQVILRERFSVQPRLQPFPAGTAVPVVKPGEAYLYIGDKVVNAAPPQEQFPHQLDLGEQWKNLTGLPFVFAMWMMRADAASAELANLLAATQRAGAGMTDVLVERYAAATRWPTELARQYFTHYLKYDVTPAARQGVARFFALAAQHDLLPSRRPIQYFGADTA